MSQAGRAGTAGPFPPSVLQTITGNDGIPESPIANNFNLLTSNTTVQFIGSPATETLDFGLSNLILGSNPGTITSGNSNVGLGYQSLFSLSTGTQNTGIGQGALASLQSGQNNTAVGFGAAALIVSSYLNTAIGESSLASFNSAINTGKNVAIGAGSGVSLLTGVNNIFLGYLSGQNYNGAESSNITIGHVGVAAESNKIRIGTSGSGAGQNQAFLAGVTGVTAAASPVGVSSTGQLSDLGFGISTQVLTSNGPGVSPTWQAVSGSLLVNVTSPGAYPYTTLATDEVIIVDTSVARTIIPMAAPATGRTYRIKDNVGSAAANNITITPSGNNIDGAASYVINNNYGSVDIVYNGTQWNKF